MKLSSIFQSGAVLQRNISIPVWGYAEPGHFIKGELAGKKAVTKAAASGAFTLRFPALEAGGPHTLTVTDAGNGESVTLDDILIGEVWIASGQSNMQYFLDSTWAVLDKGGLPVFDTYVKQFEEYKELLKENSDIRAINVPQISTGIREDSLPESCKWKNMTPESCGDISAVAAWFGLRLKQKLNVPIGLICSSFGGTRVQAWISREGLMRNPQSYFEADQVDSFFEKEDRFNPPKTAEEAGYPADTENKGFANGWAAIDFDDSQWYQFRIPGSWIRQNIAGNGIVWVRKKVALPADWAGEDLIYTSGPVDKHDVVYFNGVEIGRSGEKYETKYWNLPREYRIPGNLVKAGENVIAIRAFSFVYDGSFSGSQQVYALKRVSSPEDEICFAGQCKAFAETDFGIVTAVTEPLGPGNPQTAGILYDCMINPIVPYAIRGAIWYQGESNAGQYQSKQYAGHLRCMIEDWRFRWGQGDFPFLQVELAGYTKPELYQEGGSYWSEVREQQRIVRDTMKNSYMATAIDAGEELDIHPQDKKTVGDRLAANALNRVYHFDCVPEGPVYTSYTVEGDAIRVSFRNVGKIVLKENAVRSFFVAAELTHEFFPADSVTLDGDNSLLIRCHAVKLPAAVRYAWSTNPDCTVYNDAGFPASPFRTDSW